MGLYQRHLRPRLHTFALRTALTGELRDRVCADLRGDVLEIGYGAGLNQPHLPPEVTGVWAVEPSATALKLSQERREASPVPVVVAGDDAQSLPFPDDRFDAALCTWVLCGIPDAGAALAEVARVLKPGAALHFVEHGLSPDPDVVRWQRRGNPVNRALAGCSLDTDVAGLLAASPLTVGRLDAWYEERAPKVAGYFYEGRATAGLLPRGGRPTAGLDTDDDPSELPDMTSPASSTVRLPPAIHRAAVVTPPPAQWIPTGRHSAPDVSAVMEALATDRDPDHRGRHAEPEWGREAFDTLRDEDPFDWLGFADRD